MGPFEFIITLLSFVYSLALTQILFGVARMVRHRRSVTLSASHLIWMVNTLGVLVLNWLSLWDFRKAKVLDLASILIALGFAILLYLIATFVTPDLEREEDRDLTVFHQRESRTYIGGALFGTVTSLGINIGAAGVGVTSWAAQNALLLCTVPLLILPLFIRKGWPHLLLSAANFVPICGFLVLYYPNLK
jgi:hypothetical protein